MPRASKKEAPVTPSEADVAEAINPTQEDAPETAPPESLNEAAKELHEASGLPVPDVDFDAADAERRAYMAEADSMEAAEAAPMEPFENTEDRLHAAYPRGGATELVWTRNTWGFDGEQSFDRTQLHVTLAVARPSGPGVATKFEVKRGLVPSFLSDAVD
jgi:hypothetical protein